MKWTSRQRRESRRTKAGQHSNRLQATGDNRSFVAVVLSRLQSHQWKSHQWKLYKQPRFYIAAVTAAAFLVGATTLIDGQMNQTQAWQQVFTNGQYVGLVPNQGSVLKRMQRTANGYGVQVRFTPVHANVAANYDWQSVEQLPTASYAVALNGQPVVYTANQQSAERTVAAVKKSLLPKHMTKNAQVHFTGDVGIVRTTTGVANIRSTRDAVSYLLNPVTPTLSSRGDNPLAANQSLFHTVSLQAQAAATHQAPQTSPVLQLVVHEKVTKTVSKPYKVKYIKDNQLGKGQTKVVKAGHAGRAQEQLSLTYTNGLLSSRDVQSTKVLSAPVTQVENLGTNSGLASGSWSTPVASYVVTSPFGPRQIFGHYEFHPGIDLACPQGTPVHATNNGIVEAAGWNSGGYGNWVKINNGNGIETVFGHNSRVVVHAGETVSKGQLIAYSGQTGDATGPHCHYEVRKNGTPINPVPYM